MPFDTPKGGNKKKVLIIGGVAVGGAALFILYRKMKGGSSAGTSATAATDTSGIDPNTGIPYSQEGIDPNTGVPYADESGYGLGSAVGSPYGGYGGYGSSFTGSPAPTTNAEWAVAAENALVQDGFDPGTVAVALGLYLSGQSLTSNQYQIVQAALGMEGQPPNAVAPPHMTTGGTGGTGGSNGSGKMTTVPNVVGKNKSVAIPILAAKGFGWTPGTKGSGPLSKVTAQNPPGGFKASAGTKVDLHFPASKK